MKKRGRRRSRGSATPNRKRTSHNGRGQKRDVKVTMKRQSSDVVEVGGDEQDDNSRKRYNLRKRPETIHAKAVYAVKSDSTEKEKEEKAKALINFIMALQPNHSKVRRIKPIVGYGKPMKLRAFRRSIVGGANSAKRRKIVLKAMKVVELDKKMEKMLDGSDKVIYVKDLLPVPKHQREAMKRPDWPMWKEAEMVELARQVELGVFELVIPPEGRKLINSMWVYDYKVGENGELLKYKARLVAVGSSQEEGVDYSETFSPVIRVQVVRLMIVLALYFGLDIDQMDVSTAFLYADLKQENYMRCPPGYPEFQDGRPLVWKLVKSIYGLHQASREWYHCIKSHLESIGYKASESAVCLFHKVDPETKKMSFVLVYVDDLMIATSDQRVMTDVKDKLKKKFTMKDLGKAKWLLKIRIEDRENGTWIGQPSYVESMLSEIGMWDDDSTITDNPMSATWSHDEMSEKLSAKDSKLFHSLVMKVAYLSNTTRPDINYAANTLASHQMDPRVCDWNALVHLLKYLKGTHDLGIFYSKKEDDDVGFIEDMDLIESLYPEIYGDASFAEEEGRKSRSGYVFVMGGGAIFWYSKKQPVVSISTTEAEYYALSETVKESIWLRNLMKEISLKLKKPFKIHQDNKSTISIAMNPVSHSRTKHIDIRHHFIRQHIAMNDVELVYCETEEMVADVMTKALPAKQHWKLISMMGMRRLSDLTVKFEDEVKYVRFVVE